MSRCLSTSISSGRRLLGCTLSCSPLTHDMASLTDKMYPLVLLQAPSISRVINQRTPLRQSRCRCRSRSAFTVVTIKRQGRQSPITGLLRLLRHCNSVCTTTPTTPTFSLWPSSKTCNLSLASPLVSFAATILPHMHCKA